MIKTAVIGASGFIGGHLWRSYRQVFPDCVGTSFSRPLAGSTPFDIRQPDLAALRLEETGHQSVIVTSAKPNINYCAEQPEAAYEVNVAGTLELIRQIGRTSLSVIFLSSDYVFDGTTPPYGENDETRPTTEYGRHKVLVEREIPSLCSKYLILRLSKIFGLKKGDGTLIDDLAKGLASGQEIKAAADQYFCPTEVTDLVRSIQIIQASENRRVMNVCNPETWSRYELAHALAEAMHADASRIQKIALYDIPAMRGRPLRTSMVCSQLTDGVPLRFTPIQEAVRWIAANWIGVDDAMGAETLRTLAPPLGGLI